MTTSLTTFDGYPRADIDVAQIRTTRARIVHLKTDYKILMVKLEKAVHEQFAAGKASEAAAASNVGSTSTSGLAVQGSSSSRAAIEPPFAKVNTVVPNSPADQAGLRMGDKVVKFGGANWTNHERLAKVAQVVQQNENVCELGSCGNDTLSWMEYLLTHSQQTILVRVLREPASNTPSQDLELRLVPRRDWGGRGLLGCHLLPL